MGARERASDLLHTAVKAELNDSETPRNRISLTIFREIRNARLPNTLVLLLPSPHDLLPTGSHAFGLLFDVFHSMACVFFRVIDRM